MHIHFLGICGTFMGGLAKLAKDLGYKVTGQDSKVYPPMSTELSRLGISIYEGYEDIELLPNNVDCVVIGNVMRRGMLIVEYLLNSKINIISGPEFLAQKILKKRHVLAVTGTHGKTTTTSMLAWILTFAGLNPGFLIGGISKNLKVSASLGGGDFFVIEGDEYDSAFFDKQSKFLHYNPKTLIINNIEYDHADIFPDLAAIKKQFHYLIRTIPGQGKIIHAVDDENILSVLGEGCWTPTESVGLKNGDWNLSRLQNPNWAIIGKYNQLNALAAIAAANNIGVEIEKAVAAMHNFFGVKRRLELKGKWNGITLIEDFAHHPTAIKMTLEAVKNKVLAEKRTIAVVELASNSMRSGIHFKAFSKNSIFAAADRVYFYTKQPLAWLTEDNWLQINKPGGVYRDSSKLLEELMTICEPGDCLLLMSNGSFDGLIEKLEYSLKAAVVL